MNITGIDAKAAANGLFVMGALHEAADTIVLIGAEKGMWPLFTASPEYGDGDADPLDRWSKRIIGAIAETAHASTHFPSDGPPYLPFIAWAKATGRFWQSPTGMLVHDVAGLMISIRGAIRIAGEHPLPTTKSPNPCDGCSAPCADACPVAALSRSAPYDVPTCKTHVASLAGQDCFTKGCQVRRICPVSDAFERDPAQSSFHMRSFMGA